MQCHVQFRRVRFAIGPPLQCAYEMIGGVAVCLGGLKQVMSNSFETRSSGFDLLPVLATILVEMEP